jgi:hypothetical protein
MSLINLDNQAIYLKSIEFSDGTTQIPPVVYRFSVPNITGLLGGGVDNLVYTTPISFEAGVYLVEHNIAIGSGMVDFDSSVGVAGGLYAGTNLSVIGRQSGNNTGTGGNPATSGNPSNGGITTVFKCPHCSVFNNPTLQPFTINSSVQFLDFATYQAGGVLGGEDYTGLMSFTITKIN